MRAGPRSVVATPVRKWGPWALLLTVAAVVLAMGLHSSKPKPTLDAQVQQLSSEVRCPVCQGENSWQSQAAPSVEIRNEIRADLVKGESHDQIIASIVAAYGPGILEKPQASGINLLIWTVPVAAAVLGAAGLWWRLRRWKGGPAREAVFDPDAGVGEPPPMEPPVATPPVAAPPVAPPPVAAPPVATPASTRPRLASRLRPASRRRRVVVALAGVVLVAGGASWAVAASSGSRLPGQEITGQALAPQTVAAGLASAENDQAKNDVVDAVKEYQKVLDADPTQIQALTGEGWLLAETGQPALLRQGLGMLAKAEQTQPGYAPAHVYRGIALLSEADYSDSIPELQWYLDHQPAPQLVAEVQRALTQARTGQAAEANTSGAH